MCSEAVVRVRWVVSISALGEMGLGTARRLVEAGGVRAITPCKDGGKAPRSDLGFGVYAGRARHGGILYE